jgi:hypothetical protein
LHGSKKKTKSNSIKKNAGSKGQREEVEPDQKEYKGVVSAIRPWGSWGKEKRNTQIYNCLKGQNTEPKFFLKF